MVMHIVARAWQCIAFGVIPCKAEVKGSDDDPFVNLDEAEVDDFEVLENLKIKNNRDYSSDTGRTLRQPVNPHLCMYVCMYVQLAKTNKQQQTC